MTDPASRASLHLHDTLRGERAAFVPAHAGEATVYCCGPTTYDVAHVGHARAAIVPDILVRHLRAKGLRVKYVRNITDVDDKILKRAKESGEEPTALSARMATLYQADMRRLGCAAPDVEPKVSEHIEEILSIIDRLLENGAAYAVELEGGVRDVYFAVRSFAPYGKLSRRKPDELRSGARIEVNEKKRDPLDFALWKGCTKDEWGWDTRHGRGRPGWHIECSAMSAKHLGHGFDVHCGGTDLIFPHHENEIAQSEAAYPEDGAFARLWVHNGHVTVDKEKMSKSLKNFFTLKEVFEHDDPEAVRYFLLTTHYRGPLDFDTEHGPDGSVRSFPAITEAEKRVDYLYGALERLEGMGAPADAPPPKELAATQKLAKGALARVEAALDDDLNTPVALAVVGELAKAANELADLWDKRRKDERFRAGAAVVGGELRAALRAGLDRLGLLSTPASEYRARTQAQRLARAGLTVDAIEAKLAERAAAREAKDFARGDAIRAELLALRVEVADGPAGTTWRIGV